MENSIGIIGGGAAGIFAALGAHSVDPKASVLLFERNPRLGIKILVSGGGKCNITHDGPVDKLLKEGFLVKQEQRFLRHAIYSYPNTKVLEVLERNGVTWHARENGRIFPDSSRAEDVLAAFESELALTNTQILTNHHVIAIERIDEGWEIRVPGKSYQVNSVILATGGVSYQKVGTTGDGIRFAEMLDHTIAPLRAALAPIHLSAQPPAELQGVAIRSGILRAVDSNGKLVIEEEEDILFTARGISGPAALNISREVARALESGTVALEINLLAKAEEEIEKELIAAQQGRANQQVNTWLEAMLPNRLVPYVMTQATIVPDQKWNTFSKSLRTSLRKTLTHYSLGKVHEVPIDRGEVTAGGVDLSEVDPKTMMSKKHRGLFFAGEMLDVAGEIGGYNLQAAYSTGWLAGNSAVNLLKLR